MKLWIDDVRPAPEGYIWIKRVNEAKEVIVNNNAQQVKRAKSGLDPDPELYIDIISLDHDAGDYAYDGGDYIELLNWLEWLHDGRGTYTKFHLHSMNPVGVANMRAIIEHNGWEEIYET